MQLNLSESLKDKKEEEFVDKMSHNVGQGRTRLAPQPPGKEWESLSKSYIPSSMKREVVNPNTQTNPKDFYHFNSEEKK